MFRHIAYESGLNQTYLICLFYILCVKVFLKLLSVNAWGQYMLLNLEGLAHMEPKVEMKDFLVVPKKLDLILWICIGWITSQERLLGTMCSWRKVAWYIFTWSLQPGFSKSGILLQSEFILQKHNRCKTSQYHLLHNLREIL